MKREKMIQEMIEATPVTKCVAGDIDLRIFLEIDLEAAETKTATYHATEDAYYIDVDDRQVEEELWDRVDDSFIATLHSIMIG